VREGACLRSHNSTRRICGRWGTWRTLLTLSVCIPSFGPRSACLLALSLTRRICGRWAAWQTPVAHAFSVPSFGSRNLLRASKRRPRSVGLAARPWRFRSASPTLVSGGMLAQGALHVGWNNSWDIPWHIESRFANVLVCAGLFAQECKTSGFADLLKRRSRATISERPFTSGGLCLVRVLFYCPHLASLAAVGAL
jgi:hypothetical protein